MDSSISEAPAQPSTDLTGRTLGEYVVLRKLGQGGMGQVYLAEQRSLKRNVALKILKAELASNPNSLQRFKAEAEAVARVTHANIVQVYAIGESDGLNYMALEYVEGRNLRDYMQRKGTPELLLALSIMRQVASALQRAAEMGIIHRDIKPENILLTKKGEVKVADFGLSRCLAPDQQPLHLTQSGVTMGTPLYMSPEQVEGKPVDPRTDIYSFGVTCYHMFAGNPPYSGTNPFEVALLHVRGEPTPLQTIRPDLPPELCLLVHKLMAKSPDQRYQSAKEVLKDLARVREGLSGITHAVPLSLSFAELGSGSGPIVGSAVASGSAMQVPTKRGLHWGWVVASLVLALGAGGALGWWEMTRQRGPENLPDEVPVLDPTSASYSPQKREQWLKEGAENYMNPANGYKNPEGLSSCLHLALLYLNDDRWDKAGELFGRLTTLKDVPRAQMLGELGLAVVTGLRSDVSESQKHFANAIPEKNPPREKLNDFQLLLKLSDEFNWYLSEAIFYNQANGGRDQRVLLNMIRRSRVTLPPPNKGGIPKRPETSP